MNEAIDAVDELDAELVARLDANFEVAIQQAKERSVVRRKTNTYRAYLERMYDRIVQMRANKATWQDVGRVIRAAGGKLANITDKTIANVITELAQQRETGRAQRRRRRPPAGAPGAAPAAHPAQPPDGPPAPPPDETPRVVPIKPPAKAAKAPAGKTGEQFGGRNVAL